MRLALLIAAALIATPAWSAEAPKPAPTVADVQKQLDAANAKIATMTAVVSALQQQRNQAQAQAADLQVQAYAEQQAAKAAQAPAQRDAPNR